MRHLTATRPKPYRKPPIETHTKPDKNDLPDRTDETTMNDDLSLAEVERRLKSGDWYYDWLLRRWVDRRDGKLAIALDTMRDLTRKVKALDDAAWLAEVEAATADACAAGIDPAAYAQRLRDERKA